MPIDRHPVIKTKFAISDNLSRTAITHWTVEQEWKDYSLLELKPLTGRTHQLRVHLQHLGHPIVADPTYGLKKKLAGDLAWCPRLFLHAQKLEFDHPESGESVSFESKLPAELTAALNTLVD
jgi:23S rRNA pseudouridine1911/1915/1917 synthase